MPASPTRLATALLAVAACTACGPPRATEAPVPEFADLVLCGGKVVTVDPALGTVQAVAVKGHQIAAVGDDASIAACIGPNTPVIELRGRLALPGFIEGHGHSSPMTPRLPPPASTRKPPVRQAAPSSGPPTARPPACCAKTPKR